MKKYTTKERVEILKNCKTATELLKAKEYFLETYSFDFITEIVYEQRMRKLFISNEI